jgi:hypothetical protein
MKTCMFRALRRLQAFTLAGVIGFATPAAVALAQGSQGGGNQAGSSQGGKSETSAAASKSSTVGGVVVQSPHKRNMIPPEKRAAFDAEAAKQKSWQKYRSATPSPTPGGAPGVSATARTKGYPGLHSVDSN